MVALSTNTVAPKSGAMVLPSVPAPLVHPLHPLNASFASFRDCWLSSNPAIRPQLLEQWRRDGRCPNEKKLLRAMEQMLGQIDGARERINRVSPGLLRSGTAAEVFHELYGIDVIRDFAVKPPKKSFWDKIPPVLSISVNDYASGFASPFASFAVGAAAASLAYFFPSLFFDTFPKLDAHFDWSWFLKIFGFSTFCTYLVSGWKNFFGEFLPKNYHLKSKYLEGREKFKKYMGLQLHEGLVGLQTGGILKDFEQRTRVFDSAKKYLGKVPLVGKFIKTLPETSGEAITFATDIGLNIFATAAFLFIMKGSDFKLVPALMPSAILTLFNCFGTTYITKSVKDSPGKIVAFRQILGIALFVFAAATTTEFGGQFVMSPVLRAGSQVLAGLAMLAGVGTFVKASPTPQKDKSR